MPPRKSADVAAPAETVDPFATVTVAKGDGFAPPAPPIPASVTTLAATIMASGEDVHYLDLSALDDKTVKALRSVVTRNSDKLFPGRKVRLRVGEMSGKPALKITLKTA